LSILFNIYIEEMMRGTMEEVKQGLKVLGGLTKSPRFADDQAMIAASQKVL